MQLWRWGRSRMSFCHWRRWFKGHGGGKYTEKCSKTSKRAFLKRSTVSKRLDVCGRPKKREKWLPCELSDGQRRCSFEMSRRFFYAIATTHFSAVLRPMSRNGTSLTTDVYRLSGSIAMKLRSTSQGRSCTKRSCWPFEFTAGLVHHSFFNSCEAVAAEKKKKKRKTKLSGNHNGCPSHYSIERRQPPPVICGNSSRYPVVAKAGLWNSA